jgi:hypothetical protein
LSPLAQYYVTIPSLRIIDLIIHIRSPATEISIGLVSRNLTPSHTLFFSYTHSHSFIQHEPFNTYTFIELSSETRASARLTAVAILGTPTIGQPSAFDFPTSGVHPHTPSSITRHQSALLTSPHLTSHRIGTQSPRLFSRTDTPEHLSTSAPQTSGPQTFHSILTPAKEREIEQRALPHIDKMWFAIFFAFWRFLQIITLVSCLPFLFLSLSLSLSPP